MEYNRKRRMESLLRETFPEAIITITDDSAKHAGHVGAPTSGQSHYTVHVVDKALGNLSRVKAHRLIHTALETEFSSGLHALRIIIANA